MLTSLRKHRGFHITCAIKKIARQEELVPSHASTSECLQRFEEVVRTTLPRRMNGAFMWTGFLIFDWWFQLVAPYIYIQTPKLSKIFGPPERTEKNKYLDI